MGPSRRLLLSNDAFDNIFTPSGDKSASETPPSSSTMMNLPSAYTNEAFRKRAILPLDLTGFDVDRGERSGAEIATRSIDVIAHAHHGAVMNAQPVVAPELLHGGLAAGLRERHLQSASAGSVGGADDQDIIVAPHGHRDVQIPRSFVRMRPQQLTVRWIDAGDDAVREILTIFAGVVEKTRSVGLGLGH